MKLTSLTDREQAEALKALQDLKASPGWTILKDIIQEEQQSFFRNFSAPKPSTSIEEVHYTRGIIEGTFRLLALPDKVATLLEDNLLLTAAAKKAKAP